MNKVSEAQDGVCGALLEHAHALVKDPMWLGWRCGLPGCGFFKSAWGVR